MQLFLDERDLKPEVLGSGEKSGRIFPSIDFSDVTFDHLNTEAQKAVLVVGRATYRATIWAGSVIGAVILPPSNR